MYSVYLLRCRDGSFYCGSTNHVERRVRQHQNGTGAKYTRGRRPVELVYVEPCEDHGDALRREYAIKKLNRVQKQELITSRVLDV